MSPGTTTFLVAALLAVGGVSGCGGELASDKALAASPSSPVPSACNASTMSVTAHPARTDPTESVELRLKNSGATACVVGRAPLVVLDSGYGPHPAIDGTAYPYGVIELPSVLEPGRSIRLVVSWGAAVGCEPNHRAPIVNINVRFRGDRRFVAISASKLPTGVAPSYCWIDGAELSQPKA